MYYVSKESINIAMRQIDRWIKAAKQDKHPGVMMLHINYAMGDLVMLREMTDDKSIEIATGVNPFKLYAKITNLQDLAQSRLLKICK